MCESYPDCLLVLASSAFSSPEPGACSALSSVVSLHLFQWCWAVKEMVQGVLGKQGNLQNQGGLPSGQQLEKTNAECVHKAANKLKPVLLIAGRKGKSTMQCTEPSHRNPHAWRGFVGRDHFIFVADPKSH